LSALVTAPLGINPNDPQAIQELPWRSDSVRRAFAPRYLHAFGLRAVALRQAGRVAEADGMRILEGGAFAFDIAEEVGSDLDETVELALVVDPAVGRLLVGWDANVAAENAISVEVPAEDEPWVTVAIPLERARFAGRGPRATDVVVAAPGCEYAEGATGPNVMRIRQVSVRRPARAEAAENRTACLELTLLDEDGAPTAARIGIYDIESGREVLPGVDAVPIVRYLEVVRDVAVPTSGKALAQHAARLAAARLPRRRPVKLISTAARMVREMPGRETAWPSPSLAGAGRRLAARVRDRGSEDRGSLPASRWIVYANGRYAVSVPPGTYEVIATRGPEYRHLRRRVEVAGSDVAHVELRFERWRDLPAEGWWSGDAHIHIARGDVGDEAALSIARAEDLHVANLLAMGNIGAQYFDQPGYGLDGRVGRDGYNLVSGQEDPRTGRRGHTVHLNIAERARNVNRYFLYHELFERLRAGGSLSGYAHVGSDWFGESVGLALDVPFGIVDVVEVLQAYRLRIQPWYDFLNLGFRLTPIAGSDYPYVDPAGAVRFFVGIDGPLTPDAWFDAIRAGRTFVSNGPMLSLHVGAATMGGAAEIEPGESLLLHAEADVNPDLDELQRLELVVHGEVVAVADGPGRVEVEHRLIPEAGCWVAARAVGSNNTVAHSAPVYVTVGGAKHTWHAPSVPDIVDRMEAQLRNLVESTPDPLLEDFEIWDSEASYLPLWLEVLPELKIRVDQAIDRYERIRVATATGG
jgi:hypothetical protein